VAFRTLDLLPQEIRSTQEWIPMKRHTTLFLGSFLPALGDDRDSDFDRRVWIVGVPLQAKS
jgi:hypothetical protein